MTLVMSLEAYKPTQNATEAIEQVVLANRILANERVLDQWGHVSVRNPENSRTFFQSRSLAPELVTKGDILEIDLDGNVVTRTDMKPYVERMAHAAILKARPDVNAVFHGHPHAVIPFSSTGIPIRPIVNFGSWFYQGIPLYDDYDVNLAMLIATPEEGEKLARVLGNAKAVLLRDHGCCVVGSSVPTMVIASISLRDNAIIQYQTIQLGNPKYLSDEEGRRCARIQESDLAVQRAWDYLVSRAGKAMPDLK